MEWPCRAGRFVGAETPPPPKTLAASGRAAAGIEQSVSHLWHLRLFSALPSSLRVGQTGAPFQFTMRRTSFYFAWLSFWQPFCVAPTALRFAPDGAPACVPD